MASADEYAAWIVANQAKKGTPEFETVAKAYKQAKAIRESSIDPTADMSLYDKVAAGAGKAVYDTARGVGQLFGLVSQEDVNAADARDKALMGTGGGIAGNVVGNVALMSLPGLSFSAAGRAANAPKIIAAGRSMYAPTSIPAAAVQGSAFGAAQPVSENDTRIGNAITGALGGAAVPAIIGATKVGASLLAPMSASGRDRLAGQALERFATDPSKIATATVAGKIPGSLPTLAELVDDIGLSQLQRTLLNNPDSAAPIVERLRANNAARVNALQQIAGDEGKRAFFEADRAAATAPLYEMAFAQTAHDTPWIKGQITQLMKRPAFQKAWSDAVELAQNFGVKIDPENVTQVSHYAKMALDDQISSARMAGNRTAEAALVDTRNKLVSLMESDRFSPAYREARKTYAEMSRPINQMQVGQQLLDTLRPALAEAGADTRVNAASYAKALRDADATARKATGFSGAKLESIMEPGQLQTLRAIAEELGNSARAQELGAAKGSPTGQNLISQEILRQVLGPLGLPKTWAEAVLPQRLMTPVQMAYKPAEQRVLGLLGEAMIDPAAAKELLNKGRKVSSFSRLAANYGPYLSPVGSSVGLLGLSQ